MLYLGLLLALAPTAPDWEQWYATQLRLRSEPPKPEHAKWMAAAAEDCGRDDVVACAYMLTFRAFPIRDLSHAAEVVLSQCANGERNACEAALYIADHFHVFYYQHALLSLRAHYAQDVYRAACVSFGAGCAKFDLDACRNDKANCKLSDDDLALFEIRRAGTPGTASVSPRPAHLRALGRLCADRGGMACRARDFLLFQKGCATDPAYCFAHAYDAFLRSPAEAKEDELFAALPTAQADTPARWLTDARVAACLREFATCYDSKLQGKDKALMKRLKASVNCKKPGPNADAIAAVRELDMAHWPAALTVLLDAVDPACGKALSDATGELQRKRQEFLARRKATLAPLEAQLPGPRTAPQSAMRSFMLEREEAIAEQVARYSR